MTSEQRGIVFHASGLSQSKERYRNHYCTQADDPNLLALVKSGHMTGPHRSSMLPQEAAYFYLTDEGIALAWFIKKEIAEKRS